MKHVDDKSFMCAECTGAGCKLCSGTGYYYGEHLFNLISQNCDSYEKIGETASAIQRMLHDKDREIAELKRRLEHRVYP